MLVVKLYTKSLKAEWDNFLTTTKNFHFMFYRNYMDYHAHRFQDFSLMCYNDKKQLIALLPGNINENIFYSHQGLSFGGFLVNASMKTPLMLELFDSVSNFLRDHSISRVIYKLIPRIYHSLPTDEEQYALFVNNAKLMRRDVSSAIKLSNKLVYQEQRGRAVKKAKNNQLVVKEMDDISDYWVLLSATLKTQHDKQPAHSVEEMQQLKANFSENIRLFVAVKEKDILAGALVYETEKAAHTQYLAASEAGRKMGALDLIIDELIHSIYHQKTYLDFGISNEENGRYLNTGLIAQKEGFGARAIVHDFYEWDLVV